jgi:ribosomal protein S18 acetylase RimI-like enzyme
VIDNEVDVGPLASGDLVALAQCHALYCTAFPAAAFPPIARDATHVWVAKREGRAVGFIATRTIGRMFEIHAIAVDTEHRGAGIGRALLREAVAAARARKRAWVVLQVSTANVAACALYESEGFVVKRTLHRYYSPATFANGGDAYQMQLSL